MGFGIELVLTVFYAGACRRDSALVPLFLKHFVEELTRWLA